MTLNSHTFLFTALRFHFIVSQENKALKKCILAIMASSLQAMYVLSFLKVQYVFTQPNASSLSFRERKLSRKHAQQCMRKRFELVFTAFSDCCSTKNFPFPSLIFSTSFSHSTSFYSFHSPSPLIMDFSGRKKKEGTQYEYIYYYNI